MDESTKGLKKPGNHNHKSEFNIQDFKYIVSGEGPAGKDGIGVPTGGSTGQALIKKSSQDYDTEWRDIGNESNGGDMAWLPNVDETGTLTWRKSATKDAPTPCNIKGEQGAAGPQGPQGEQGPAGAKGEKGDPGPEGSKGSKGDTGERGEQGPVGPQGVKGDAGEDGRSFKVLGQYGTVDELTAANPTGEAGDAYIVGNTEENVIYIWDINENSWVNIGKLLGPQGLKGDKGDRGEPGESGPQGAKGETGDAATIAVGRIESLPYGTEPYINNIGSETDAIFNFGIPQGKPGTVEDNSLLRTVVLPASTTNFDDIPEDTIIFLEKE